MSISANHIPVVLTFKRSNICLSYAIKQILYLCEIYVCKPENVMKLVQQITDESIQTLLTCVDVDIHECLHTASNRTKPRFPTTYKM